jgi:transposase-like protein
MVDANPPGGEDPMTRSTVDAKETLSKVFETDHGALLLRALATALTSVMESEVTSLCGAGYDERSEERRNTRNGYRDRPLETRLGTVDLRIPKLREGSYLPAFIEPRRRWEQAFVSVVQEAYVHGVSTRKVDELVKAMGARGMSKSEVSRLCGRLDEEVDAFRRRRLDCEYPYLWLDALYEKAREGSRVVSKAVLIAYGVSSLGVREIIGVEVADGEMEDSWRRFLAGLIERGLRGVKLCISDAHEGLKKAIGKVLNGTSWQRCTVHFVRNMLSHVPKSAQGFVAAALRTVFAQTTPAAAREAMGAALNTLREKFPEVAALVEEAEEDVLAYLEFPVEHHKQIHSTNPLERQNREIRRRTDVVGIFPNARSLVRLVTMLLVEQNEEWSVGRRYFSKESMALLQAPALLVLPAPSRANAVPRATAAVHKRPAAARAVAPSATRGRPRAASAAHG